MGAATPNRSVLRIVVPLGVFLAFTLMFFARSNKGMLDDPGLGWHLRIADRMWEFGGFLHVEEFSIPSLGKPFVTYSWLGDVLMWLSEMWSGLNGVALLTATTFALTLQVLFWRMTRDGAPWVVSLAWTALAALAILPMCLAVPNMFTYLGIAITVAFCELFHSGAITRRQLLWLVPTFLVWANLHSGFLSGVLVLLTTYAVEVGLSIFSTGEARVAARRRLLWWTLVGAAIFLATLVNPNGWHLHGYLAGTANDDFIRRKTTLGWLPPDFLMAGWGWTEVPILLLPLLLWASHWRPSAVLIALSTVFLHYGLTGSRYTGLWVVIVVPTLARLFETTSVRHDIGKWIDQNTSPRFRSWFTVDITAFAFRPALAAAALVLAASPLLPDFARITLPTAALDELLQVSPGARVFHDANWGGYLTWFGRKQTPPYQTWIDDRLDVHGRDLLLEYRSILNGNQGWEKKLDEHEIDFVAVPASAALVPYLENSSRWSPIFSDSEAAIYRRTR